MLENPSSVHVKFLQRWHRGPDVGPVVSPHTTIKVSLVQTGKRLGTHVYHAALRNSMLAPGATEGPDQ